MRGMMKTRKSCHVNDRDRRQLRSDNSRANEFFFFFIFSLFLAGAIAEPFAHELMISAQAVSSYIA